METTIKKPTWTRKTLLRYGMLQIPGILLIGMVLWTGYYVLGISGRTIWTLFLLWLIKDTVMFFFVWPAYQVSEGDGWYSLNGLRGEVRKPLQPEGYIRIRGVLWKAKCEDTSAIIPAGTQVDVVGREGIVLIVRPRHKPDP
ncbi:NfeD family protein [Desulfonatronum thioautotrophicum]|uniref:NfeD family protein n=1 Tax=Desulfonatronum thioautotrophicum TaxID=617001 RepID=UPI0005EB7C09|nr:NfeD family protein [Desulfonatronum thioautotrophicum]